MSGVLSGDIVTPLLYWYADSARVLPWRTEPTPYHVWISEIMLQQTRVEAVKDYYTRFLAALPTVEALAAVPEDRLFKLWEGLGYYSRARNLRLAAKEIVNRFGGEFPCEYDDILSLPGIGSYTAGAIAAIAFGKRRPAVDGNVLRVLGRYGASDADIADPKTKKAAETCLLPLIPDRAGDFAQALIELGATVCLPNAVPRCEGCPLRGNCRAAASGDPTAYPRKKRSAERKKKHLTVLLLCDESESERRYLIRRRPDRGLLAGLYEFPNEEGSLTPEEAVAAAKRYGFDADRIERLPDARHIFTHIEWEMTVYELRGGFPPQLKDPRLIRAASRELGERYAVPSAFAAVMNAIREKA